VNSLAGWAVPDKDDRERTRKSWREIDAQRDRSAHTTRAERDRERAGKRGKPSQKSYKAALDRLFETGGIAKLLDEPATPNGDDAKAETRAKLAARVRDALGPDDITKAVDGYLTKFGRPPEDFEFLGPMLQHRNEERVTEAMDAIAALLDAGQKPRRPRAIAAQLRTIEEVSDEPELARRAHALWLRVG
jgi:hypothetical protein